MSVVARGTADRIPPSNLEAEMAVLGSILVDREMMAAVSEIVSPADFYAHVHETIFLSLVQLYERGEPLERGHLQCGVGPHHPPDQTAAVIRQQGIDGPRGEHRLKGVADGDDA